MDLLLNQIRTFRGDRRLCPMASIFEEKKDNEDVYVYCCRAKEMSVVLFVCLFVLQ